MKITVEAHINVPHTMSKLQNEQLWIFAANEWWRLISPYTPMDTGNLMENVIIRPKEIEYTQPYSHKMYERNYNFRKDKHPLASSRWDMAAEPQQKPKLISVMQEYIDSGGINLND